MTDYFALLEQPRAPWLDPATLKEVFHRKTLEQHPDTSRPGAEDEFAVLNEAYQVLQDPKRRLRHLLELQGSPPGSQQTVPAELQEMFLQIGDLNQRAKRLLEQAQTATTALSRSVLKSHTLALQREIDSLRSRLSERTETATEQLQHTTAAQPDVLFTLYFKFAYLGRWSAQLDELAFQLSAF